MARKKQQVFDTWQTSRGGRFLSLYMDMLQSEAWQQLGAYEIQLYIYMLSKQSHRVEKGIIWNSNKDNISIPKKEYREMMSQDSFERAIDNLIDKGFIKLVENRYCVRKCNIYGFNDMWTRYGKKDFYIKPEWRRTLQQQLNSKQLETVPPTGTDSTAYRYSKV